MEEATTFCSVNTEELWFGKENNGAGHLRGEPLPAGRDGQTERYTIPMRAYECKYKGIKEGILE